MASYTDPVTASTIWGWKQVKITPAGRPRTARRPKGGLMPSLSRRNPREDLTVTLKLRGGSECWVEVKGRGRVFHFIGSTCIYDALMSVCNADRHTPLSERRDGDGRR